MAPSTESSTQPAETAERIQQQLNNPLDSEQANRHLDLLGVTEFDDIVFTNWRKVEGKLDAMHQRIGGTDLCPRIAAGEWSFGFIPGKPKPVPQGWRGWYDTTSWDENLQCLWKEEVYGSKNNDIASNPALIADCDSGIDLAEAKKIVNAIGMPEPTFIINTGGRGFHFYWVYKAPLEPEQHRLLMRRLIEAFKPHPRFGIDKQLHNPARVMRIAGSIHPATGKRTAIVEESGQQYTTEDFTFLPPVNAAVIELDDERSELDPEQIDQIGEDALSLLDHIHAAPSEAALSEVTQDLYNWWLKTGWALKECGLGVETWDEWSQGDPEKYTPGACAEKWDTFDAMASSPLAWLETAAKACGYNWFDELSGWVSRARDNRPEAVAAAKARKEQQARWDYGFDYEIDDTETVELKCEKALRTKLAHHDSDAIYFNGVLRRYDPATGYYRPWGLSEMQGEIGNILARFFTYKKKGDGFVPVFKNATTPIRKRCSDWLGPQLYVDSERYKPKAAIAFRNCTLVKTAEGWVPEPHSKANQLTHGIDHDYVEGAECPPLFKEFVRTSFGLQWLDVWRAMVHYHANPLHHCQLFLFFLGQSGSGKGVALRLLQKIYNVDQVSSLNSFTAIDTPEKLAQHVAKSYLICFPDLQGRQDAGVGALYPLADYGQVFSGRDLFSKDPLRFLWRGRVILASTQMPNLKDANSGFKRRVMVIPTLEKPLPSDLIPSDPRKQDVWEDDLAAELGQIISWAMAMPEADVAKILAKDHPELKKARKAMEANIDTLHSFVDQCLEPADIDTTSDPSDLYSAYCCFLVVMGQRSPLSYHSFKLRLKQILPHLHRGRQGGGKSKETLLARYVGVQLVKGLWSTSGAYEYKSDGVQAPGGNHGTLLRTKLIDGQLELLEAHDPTSSNSMTADSAKQQDIDPNEAIAAEDDW